MVVIFLILYFLVQLTKEFKWKVILRKFIDFTVVSISAGLSSCIMLLPTYLDLSTHCDVPGLKWFYGSHGSFVYLLNFVGSLQQIWFIPLREIFPLIFIISLRLNQSGGKLVWLLAYFSLSLFYLEP